MCEHQGLSHLECRRSQPNYAAFIPPFPRACVNNRDSIFISFDHIVMHNIITDFGYQFIMGPRE